DAGYTPVTDIVYASDFSYQTSVQLFRPLLEIAGMSGAKIHILNITKPREKATTREVAGVKHTENVFESVNHEYVTVTSESITRGISDYVKDQPGRLLAMVAHKHTFFERIFSRN